MALHTMKQKIKEFLDIFRLIKTAESITKSVQNNSNNSDVVIDIVESSNDFRLSQNRAEIMKIMGLLHSKGNLRICEIGTYKGGSLFCLAQAAPPGATILSIDIEYPVSRRLAHRKFAKNGQKIICIEGDTKDPATFNKAKRALGGEKLDLLFIDGDHAFTGVVNDYARYSPLVKKGGIIAFHDIQPVQDHETNVKAYVGEVPIFWDAIKRAGFLTEEVIEDPQQAGKGIGILYL